VVADGAYDSKSNFRLLADRGIEPVIKVRKNASFKAGGCIRPKSQNRGGGAAWKPSMEKREGLRLQVDGGVSLLKHKTGVRRTHILD